MKTFRCLCVCLCVMFLSIGFSASALAEIYTLTGRAKSDGSQLGGITPKITDLTSADTLVVTADAAQIWLNPGATLNCNIEISGSTYNGEKTGKIRLQSLGNVIKGVVTLGGDTVISSSSSAKSYDVRFDNQITGTGSMIYAAGSSSTVTLRNTSNSALNNYKGNTYLGYADQYTTETVPPDYGIKVVLGASEQIPDAITSGSAAIGNLVMNAFTATQYGSLNLNGFNETVNGLVSGGTTPGNAVIFNNSTTPSVLTVGGNNATAEYSGKIGTGGTNLSLVKVGTGTQTLSGANTYTGGTTISAGTLAITNSDALGTGAITLNGGTLSTSETITLNENIAINANSSIDTANGLTLSGNISGSAALTKTGAGVLTISGTNTYSGGTTISGGTMAITNSEALGTGAITLNGGTLSTNATNSISLNENIAINANSSIDTVNGLTLSGSISGNGALTKTGSGTLTLSGANTFNGGMTISEGKVSVATGSNTLGSGALTLNSFTTLIITDGDSNNTLNITGTATLNGTLDLSSYLSTWNTGSTYTLMTATSIGSTEGLTISGVDTGWIYTVEGSTIKLKYLENTNWTWTGSSNTSFKDPGNWDKGIAPVSGSDIIIHSGTTNTANVDSDASVKTVALDAASNLQFTAGKTLTTQSMTISGENQTLDLTGGNLTLITVPAFDITNSDSANASTLTLSSGTYSNVLSGNTNLTKIEADTLTLSGENTYTGATTISGGTLVLDANNAIATSASVTVENNAEITATSAQTFNNLSGTESTASINLGTNALTLKNTADSTYAGTITATSLTKTGTGTLTLSNTNTYSSGTTISAGTLQADNASALGTGTVTIDQNGTLNWNNTTDLANKISGAGTLKLSQGRSTGTDYGLDSQLQNFTGTIDLCAPDEDDRIRIRWNVGTKTEFNKVSLVKISSGNEFWVSTMDASFDCNWEIAGTGAGAGGDDYPRGALRIDKNAVFTGNVSLSADASIKPRGTNALATFSGNIDLKAHNLTIQSDNLTNSTVLTGNILSTGGTGSLINGTGSSSTTMTLKIGDTTAAGSATTQTVSVNIQQNNTISPLIFQPGENRNIAVSGIISGDGAFEKTGAGTLTLSAANTYTGATTISAGRIIATNDSALGTGTVTNNSELEFNLMADDSGEYRQVISGSGALYKTGAGTLTLSAANTYEGNTTISEGRIIATNTSAFGTGKVNNNSELEFNLAGIGEYSKVLSGSGTLIKSGAGTLTLSVANTYEGNTTISGGRIIATNTSALGTGMVTNNSELEFNLATDGEYSKVISGSGKLIKSGAGTLTLSVANTYEGNTTISGGTLNLGVADAIANSTSVLVNTGITFGTTTQTLQNLSGSGTISGSGALTLFNDSEDNSTYSGIITGVASVTKTGAGTLTLSGSNDYRGAVIVSAGTLALTGTTNLNNSASITNNGTITAESNQTFNNLSGTESTASINLTNKDLELLNTGSTPSKFVGRINVGTGTIRKTGPGTLQLLGASENDIKASSFVVNSGRLDMKGYLTGSLVVETGAEFSPGNSVGTTNVSGDFTLTGNLIMEVESADSYDILNIAGATTYNEGSRIVLNLYVPTGAETLELNMINYTGIGGVTGTENWVLGENARYWQDVTFSNGKLNIKVNLNAIPEPSTWALLILGALGMMYFRRKK